MIEVTESSKPFGIVYAAIHKPTGKQYIGATTTPLHQRICVHKSKSKQGKDTFMQALRELGTGAHEKKPKTG